jgi:hypothetical protein
VSLANLRHNTRDAIGDRDHQDADLDPMIAIPIDFAGGLRLSYEPRFYSMLVVQVELK